MSASKSPDSPGTDFIRQIVERDLEAGRYSEVVTRFPPEPNGYLHLGHVKAICVSFGVAHDFGGRCHLRYDDTNPEKESEEYALSMQDDIRWLGFDWGEHLYYASDYFEQMYDFAVVLIQKGLAYVDSQDGEAIREGRGTVTEPGVESPYRNRSVEENLDLFGRMRAGEFADGEHVLRARIDMAASNMLMRDPVLYRIRHAHHYRQGDAWCIYPLYDYAHCLEDAIEGVTHSLCTIEFELNRELYDWVLDHVGFEEPRPHQYEFAPLIVEHAVLSKRKIGPLVKAGAVSGWDDPRLSTIRGIRRRGVPPEALRGFVDMVGVARTASTIDVAKFEFAVREALNLSAPRVMAVLDPLKVVLTNWPEGKTDTLEAPYYPHDVPLEGSRDVPFGRELWIERDDFAEDPPKGFRRLVPGGEVRLRYAYVIRCDEVVHDDSGAVVELRCTVDPDSRGGSTADGRKVKGTIQWVSAEHGLDAEVRLLDRLFLEPEEAGVEPPAGADGDEEPDLLALVNPESLVVVEGAKVEPSVASDPPETRYQFERTGYFWRDPVDGVGERLVFNRIVALKDGWGAKREEVGPPKGAESGAGLASPGRSGEDDDPSSKARTAQVAAADAPHAERAAGARPAVSEQRSAARDADPELAARFARYQSEWGISEEHADVLTGSRASTTFFDAAVAEHDDAPEVAGWMAIDLRGLMGDRELGELPFEGAALGRLAALVSDGRLTRRAGKDVLARMVERGGDPAALVSEMGLERVADEAALEAVVMDVLSRWPDKVEAYRQGKRALIGMFVGEVMKATGGAADPKAAKALLERSLSDS